MLKFLFGSLCLLAAAVVIAADKPLTVFAAASTSDAIKELTAQYTAANGAKFRCNFGSSGDLARQMEQNGPADIFISAAVEWADYAVSHQLVEKASARNFLTNDLVIVAPADTKMEPFKITKDTPLPTMFHGRLSVGDPAHVPAGKYAAAALKYYGWDKALQTRYLPAANVRAALMVVELGEADLGIVYSTDALKSKKVKTIAVFPAESYPKIVYVIALGKNADPAAEKFYQFILGESGTAVFAKYGFRAIK